MSSFSVPDIVAIARVNSPVYAALYAHLPPDVASLDELPVLTHERLMEITHAQEAISFFNTGVIDGIIYQSSATTGEPKATIFGRDEWRTTMRALGAVHRRVGTIQDGDRVANLCVGAGAAFMFVHGALEYFPGRCVEVPIGADHPYDYIYSTYRKFGANVLAGVNSTLVGLACYMMDHHLVDPALVRILGGGELLYGAQRQLLQRVFPNASFVPFMYASTEVGLVGFSQNGFAANEFRVLDETSVLEILDPHTLRPIDEPGLVGAAVVTSLVRTAAPAIRVDTGDKAMWLEPGGGGARKFSIHGRQLLKRFRLPNGSTITENEIQRVVERLGRQIEIVRAILVITEDVLTFLYSDMGNSLAEHVAEDVEAAIEAVAPQLLAPPGAARLDIRRAPYAYFELRSRRKARFVEDQRTATQQPRILNHQDRMDALQ